MSVISHDESNVLIYRNRNQADIVSNVRVVSVESANPFTGIVNATIELDGISGKAMLDSDMIDFLRESAEDGDKLTGIDFAYSFPASFFYAI